MPIILSQVVSKIVPLLASSYLKKPVVNAFPEPSQRTYRESRDSPDPATSLYHAGTRNLTWRGQVRTAGFNTNLAYGFVSLGTFEAAATVASRVNVKPCIAAWAMHSGRTPGSHSYRTLTTWTD